MGEWVEISGHGSLDADDDALSYRWSLLSPPGSGATLSSIDGVATGFVADVAGAYVVQLIVNDGERDSEPDTIAVSTENSRPYAEVFAAGNGAASVGREVGLNGYYSYDPDGDALTYAWSVLSAPVGSSAEILHAQEPYAGLVCCPSSCTSYQGCRRTWSPPPSCFSTVSAAGGSVDATNEKSTARTS